MKRIFIIFLFVLSLCCCKTEFDSSLIIGKWISSVKLPLAKLPAGKTLADGLTYQTAVEFTADGNMIMTDPELPQLDLVYSVKNNTGSYWEQSEPTFKSPFTYSITSNVDPVSQITTLTLKMTIKKTEKDLTFTRQQ